MPAAQRLHRSIAVTPALVTAIVAAGAACAVGALAELDPAEHGAAPGPTTWAVTLAVLLLQSIALAGVRRAPRLALLVAAALPLVVAATAPSALFSASAVPVLVAAFSAAVQGTLRRIAVAAAASSALVAGGQFVAGMGLGRGDLLVLALESLGQGIIVVGVPIVLGSTIAAHRAAATAKEESLQAALRRREAQVGEAIARERSAMARELHDIAAHHLSGISLMASAVARQVTTDPSAARSGALQIREQSNAVLDELRSLVGLLRTSERSHGQGGDGGLETLATIAEFVASAHQTGGAVVLDVRSSPSGVLGSGIPPLAQLAAFRMVQESLTNAARHAPGAPSTVTIDDSARSELTISVTNGRGSGAPPLPRHDEGFGVLGMRERAALIGGSFDAGPTDDGGWETRMRIPRGLARADRVEEP
ncbi:sensor histidine kinase [Herbiconiux sp. A18JL235]|uniref:histidine kinase n=1 Tax=Herbiconiux sp. A18JL235 TaxID=3152363 RepID=A0AB39BGZ8_9MICO